MCGLKSLAAIILAALLASCGSSAPLPSPLKASASISETKRAPIARGYMMVFSYDGKPQHYEYGNLRPCEPSKCGLLLVAITSPPRHQKLQITLYARHPKVECCPHYCIVARETRIVDPSRLPHPFYWKFPHAHYCPE